MASLLPTVSSRIWRLNLFHKRTLCLAVKEFRRPLPIARRPILHTLYSSPLISSEARLFSSNPSSGIVQMQNPSSFSDDDVVMLGIETSCDDTAAAVVSHILFFVKFQSCVIFVYFWRHKLWFFFCSFCGVIIRFGAMVRFWVKSSLLRYCLIGQCKVVELDAVQIFYSCVLVYLVLGTVKLKHFFYQ